MWEIWKWQNNIIYNNHRELGTYVLMKILNKIEAALQSVSIQKPSRSHTNPKIDYPTGYFDGETQDRNCGCGFILYIHPELLYHVHWGVGLGTNTKAEVMALWGLLWFTHFLDIQTIHVFGDSKVVIDYVGEKATIHKSSLQCWLKQIKTIWRSLKQYSIQHICKNLNMEVDRLSKLGV